MKRQKAEGRRQKAENTQPILLPTAFCFFIPHPSSLIPSLSPVNNRTYFVAQFLLAALLGALCPLVPLLAMFFYHLKLFGSFDQSCEGIFQFALRAQHYSFLLFELPPQVLLDLTQVGEMRAMRDHAASLHAAFNLSHHLLLRGSLLCSAVGDGLFALR